MGSFEQSPRVATEAEDQEREQTTQQRKDDYSTHDSRIYSMRTIANSVTESIASKFSNSLLFYCKDPVTEAEIQQMAVLEDQIDLLKLNVKKLRLDEEKYVLL